MTRVATPHNEEGLLAHALKATAAQVQARCLGLRNADRAASTRDVNHIHRNRSLSCNRHPDGSMTITVEVTQETGELVMKAIERAMTDTPKKEVQVCGPEMSENDVENASPLEGLVRIPLPGT